MFMPTGGMVAGLFMAGRMADLIRVVLMEAGCGLLLEQVSSTGNEYLLFINKVDNPKNIC